MAPNIPFQPLPLLKAKIGWCFGATVGLSI